MRGNQFKGFAPGLNRPGADGGAKVALYELKLNPAALWDHKPLTSNYKRRFLGGVGNAGSSGYKET